MKRADRPRGGTRSEEHAVFTRLVASAATGSQFRRPAVIAGSVAAHVALLAGVIWASAPATAETATASSDLEEVTYIEIAEAPPPEDMVFEEPPADAPPPAAAPAASPPPAAAAPRRTQPAQPRTAPAQAPGAAADPNPAGFQELRTPPTVIGVAPPNVAAAPVRAEDFGGRGQVGGTAGGTRADSAGAGRIGTGAAGTAGGTGTGTGTGGTGTGDGPPTGTFSANLVDRKASLSNQSQVVRVMQRLYPTDLKTSWTEGSVRVQFVVTADGRVDMGTVQVLSTTHPQFTDATLQALKDFRFTPARKGNHNVRMLTMLPIEWKLQRQ
jgi:periplasmic protein TonB